MIEQPRIANERIIFALQECYSMRASTVEFLPIGLDSSAWAYRVQTEGGAYFLKIRKEIPNPAGILLPRALQEQGIEQVIAPVSSSRGNAWDAVDDFYFILYPFIVGREAMDVGMSGAHWIEFGSTLKRLHTMNLPSALLSQVRRETFVPKWLSWAKQAHAGMQAFEPDDALQKELAEFWLENYAAISLILQRTEALARDMQKTHLDFVLCHADIHTANILITEDDRLFIVDWDETTLRPKSGT